jgi:hypothetical protein
MKNYQRIGMATILFMSIWSLSGCRGRMGKIGKPIAERYQKKVNKLEVGVSTPEDLQRIFGSKVSLKEAKYKSGRKVAIGHVFRGGNLDLGQVLFWAQLSHDKDQSMEFRFVNNRLTSYKSIIQPDPQKR